MHKYLKPISDSHSNTNRSSKSYWTNELTCLWKEAKHRERAFLRHSSDDKAMMKANFVFAKHNFYRE